MANPIRGEVALPALPVSGFERGGLLVLDFNALCTLEGEIGPVEAAGEQALFSDAALRTVMRVALDARHGPIGEYVAGEIVQALGADRARDLMIAAFRASFPEAAASGNKDPQ